MKALQEILGAFSDGAILFPLLFLLVGKGQYSGSVLIASAGLTYLVAGLLFRIPMSVQPLKSIVISALAIHASALEVHLSGALLGATCLGLSFFSKGQFLNKIPRSLVHGLQLSLGVLLLTQGWKVTQGMSLAAAGFLSLVTVAVSLRTRVPVLGVLAALGLVLGFSGATPDVLPMTLGSTELRISLILSLVLPQIPLTLANSVVGTQDVSQRYFGEKAHRVTIVRLLRSIGIGNMLSALFSGLPFCHGSGGLTAHVWGGARTFYSNWVIGGFLLGLALIFRFYGFGFRYPDIILCSLLFSTGILHMRLAAPTWKARAPEMILMGLTALLTQNLLWAMGVGILYECAELKRAAC